MELMALATLQAFAVNFNHSLALSAAIKLVSAMEVLVATQVTIIHPDCRCLLKKLDINASVATVSALLVDLKPLLVRENCGTSIKVCVQNLHSTIDHIQEIIAQVNEKQKVTFY